MSDQAPLDPPDDPITQGARARAHGRPKESCPYPAGSEARTSWLEGYDGSPRDQAVDLPLDGG